MAKYVWNPETDLFEPKEESRRHRILRRTILAMCAFGFALLYIWLYVSVFHLDLPKTAILKHKHAQWEARMELLDRQLELYSQTLEGIEQRDDEVYRSIYGLARIPDEVKNSGLEGVNRYSGPELMGADYDFSKTIRDIDMLMKRTYVQSKALDEVGQLARQAGDMLSCVPSVTPVMPGPRVRYTSSFGYRSDPIHGTPRLHTGQDIATDKGTPVYAPGDGVVEAAGYQFGGYGNEIIIDHGFGYKTRYAHLHTMTVREGMEIKRGEQIGTVGSTGKSTGNHLHYEVIYMGVKVDPSAYMDLSITAAEYKAMIDRRKEESPIDKRLSTSELLRQGKKRDE